MPYNAIDLFCGCGGVTQGLKDAGFHVLAGVEFKAAPATVYRANHPEVALFEHDIRTLDIESVVEACNQQPLHLLAGCPPCQGFSSIRRRNHKQPVADDRNTLVTEYFRYIERFNPFTFIFENVPAIADFPLFVDIRNRLTVLGYALDYRVINVAGYGVPQRRRRFVMIGSRIGLIPIPEGNEKSVTVRDVIGNMVPPEISDDYAQTVVSRHTPRIQEMIGQIPHDGGSREDLPEKYTLACHKKENIGFHDVYGRLRWDDVSSTITGGCMNPSKGRFLHPEQDRTITAREAAMLQTFPRGYVFPREITQTQMAEMIGNALPPKFAYCQARQISTFLEQCGIQ